MVENVKHILSGMLAVSDWCVVCGSLPSSLVKIYISVKTQTVKTADPDWSGAEDRKPHNTPDLTINSKTIEIKCSNTSRPHRTVHF